MKKCDIVLPVYKSPEWVKLCVFSIFKNTDDKILNKVIIVDDCNDELTDNLLNNLKNKYNKIQVLKNKTNLGFVKSTNRGMKESKADYVLLLNTDCILSKNAIEKMINQCEKDKKIGLICPISSNAANLTYEMFPGFNFSQMNSLFEKKFLGMNFDACTVVGNCLLITRDCIKKSGYLDEAYGMGYGEETDYQFKAMSKGFKAKVAIDTYVFHKSEASFGVSEEKNARLQKNRDLFFSRWGNEYNKEYSKYSKNDPIDYINDNITEEDKKVNLNTLFYLNGIVQNAGGVHVVVDIVNYLSILNDDINIVYDIMGKYSEIMLFNPIQSNKIDDVSVNQIVATIYQSVFSAKKLAKTKKCKLLYFVQGYEGFFENGAVYGIVETSYKLADSIFTISKYLQDELKDTFNQESTLISNSVNYDLLYKHNNNSNIKNITIIMRNSVMKGDWILFDIIKKIDLKFKNLTINVIYSNEYAEFPNVVNNNLNKILGPVSRKEIYNLLHNTDVYIDCSLSEGFGLTALEAMCAGAVPIVSNSLGINEYITNNYNGIILNDFNNPNVYIDALQDIYNDKKKYLELKNNALNTCKNFDFDNAISKYSNYFNSKIKKKSNYNLNDKDKIIYKAMTRTQVVQVAKKRKIYYLAKIVPKPIKNVLKKAITFLYFCFDH